MTWRRAGSTISTTGHRQDCSRREDPCTRREARQKQEAKDREMEKLYRKHVLGEKEPEGGFVPLTALAPTSAPQEGDFRKKSVHSATNFAT